jgi:hypothetical protein
MYIFVFFSAFSASYKPKKKQVIESTTCLGKAIPKACEKYEGLLFPSRQYFSESIIQFVVFVRSRKSTKKQTQGFPDAEPASRAE